MSKKSGDVDLTIIFKFILLLILNGAGKLMTKLTKYFPFSLIGQTISWHYQNRDVAKGLDIIEKSWTGTGTFFHIISSSKDDNFIYFTGVFEPRTTPSKIISRFKSNIENKVGKGNVFFRYKENGFYNINFIRESVGIKD